MRRTDDEVDGGAKVGIFTVSFNDLTIPVSGIPITVTRTHDSRLKVKKGFRVGWELSVAAGKFTANRKLGDGWTITKKVGFLQPPCGQVNEPKRHRVEVRLSDREVFRFVPRLIETSGGLGFCEGQMVFVDAGSVRPGATRSIIGQSWVWQQTGESSLRDPDTLVVFDPQEVRLTTPEGVIFDVNRKRGITRIQDRKANVLRVTASGITSNTGLGVAFHRDAEGRIPHSPPPDRARSSSSDASTKLELLRPPFRTSERSRFCAPDSHGCPPR
ncbi:MAG: hypothetical protein HYV07_17075 [Deltaproteobacteria bacterium]|nr:hypothetical protein [Deltaproteobacteria bacterium]